MIEANRARLHEITLRPDGFAVFADGLEVMAIGWTEVLEVAAFKRDLITTDLICVAIKTKQGQKESWVELNEEIRGFEGFARRLTENFAEIDPARWSDISVPAFETKMTTLYRRGV